MKKLSQQEFVEKAISRSKRPIDLSEFEYTGSASKSKAICPEHGPFQISANALMNRIGCPCCALTERGQKRRLTQDEYITKAKEVHGDLYDYAYTQYLTSQDQVSILCKVHGLFNQGANSHLSGRGCPKCGDARVGVKSRLDQSAYLARAIEIHGDTYDLSNIKFEGMSKKIEVLCRTHGVFYPRAGNFTTLSSGCPKCAREVTGRKTRKLEASYLTDAIKAHGGHYTYGKVSYKNGAAYLTIFCKDHGKFKQLAQDHISGSGCSKCSHPVFDQASFTQAALSMHGDTYDYSLSTYVKSLDKVVIVCKSHGPFSQTPNMHVNMGQGCPSCATTGPSNGQLEVFDFVSKLANAELEWPIPGTKSRVDIMLASEKTAIEFHGLIWHSTKYKKDPKADYLKHLRMSDLGYRLIHVYQDEWERSREVVKRTLESALGVLPRVFARKCRVVEVSREDANVFFNANHLQGSSTASVHFGLTLGTELVACMGFGVARSNRRNTDQRLWELQRYAATCTVVGGASRLLSRFAALKLCHTLVSYSDTRVFNGSMYMALGFTKIHDTPPDYCYTNGSTSVGRIHKSKFQRKHLPSLLENFDHSKTEVENCFNNGWYQIFDCGKTKWELAM